MWRQGSTHFRVAMTSTARRRLRALVATARLQPYPHTRNCYIPAVNLHSTTP